MNWFQRLFRTKRKRPQEIIRKVYFIPGFGADEKIFYNLKLRNVQPVYLNWLEPLPYESCQDYAKRMAEKIDEPEPVIVGVSFGGMLALQIAATRTVKQVILVSSIRTTRELPQKWRLAGRLRLNKIFPIRYIQQNERFFEMSNRRLGAFTKEEQDFANHYRRIISKRYLLWALNEIINWHNERYPENIIHIHGDADLVFPVKATHPTHIIKGGTHMMIVNRADEISALLNEILGGIK